MPPAPDGLLQMLFMRGPEMIGKILYALLFLVLIPLGQWFWARELEDLVRFPAVQSEEVGAALAMAGTGLMGWGMFSLKKFGKGLPMNAYPPPVFVVQGPYRLVRHPIYWGYGLLMTGVFIYTGSAAGLWIITPISLLAIIALVMGYEGPDLAKRFKGARHSVWLDLPTSRQGLITTSSRLAVFFWMLSSVVLSNFIVLFTSSNSPSYWSGLPFIGIAAASEWIQGLSLLFVLLVPAFVKESRILRQWVLSALIGLTLSVFLAVLYPGLAAQYFSTISLEHSGTVLPLLFTAPVFLIPLSAMAYSHQYPHGKLFFWMLALVLSILLINGTASVYLNALTGILIFLFAAGYMRIWYFIRLSAERIANSWKEWVIGPVRIINHGFYAGLGAFGGMVFCGFALGREYAWAILLFAIVVTLGAALWAQLIEGSDKLKRPFGFYGAMLGIIIASALLKWLGYNVWLVIGALSVVMPWVQAAGRFRCLVNGCCHGRPTPQEKLGIRYFHPRSRVCTISGLKGDLLHPTQVYSILWLFLVGLVLLAIWQKQFNPSFIFGIYLILTGLGRFVEEAYRGEVQTPVWNKLRLYQWAAIITVLAGIVFTLIKVNVPVPASEPGWETWVAALAGGCFVCFAMGIDFPRSNARFSRLV